MYFSLFDIIKQTLMGSADEKSKISQKPQNLKTRITAAGTGGNQKIEEYSDEEVNIFGNQFMAPPDIVSENGGLDERVDVVTKYIAVEAPKDYCTD